MTAVAAISTVCTDHQRIHIRREKWSTPLDKTLFDQILGDDERIEGNCPDCLETVACKEM